MVLQRGKAVNIFGKGDDGTVITAEIGAYKATCTVKDGKWRCVLPPMSAAEGLTLTVTDGTNTVTFTDVAVGEVWFLGGQSNMELELQNAKDGAKYLAELTEETPVRYYYTPKSPPPKKPRRWAQTAAGQGRGAKVQRLGALWASTLA